MEQQCVSYETPAELLCIIYVNFNVTRWVVPKLGGVPRSGARNIEIGTRQKSWEWSKTEQLSKEILYTLINPIKIG
jgi:hypothetical protein